MIEVSTFKLRFPEFDDVEDARISLFIQDAVLLMETPERWLDFYDVAQAYFVAHMLYKGITMEGGDANAMYPVERQEVDDVTVEYAVKKIDPKTEDLYSTSYGKTFVMYRRICFTGIYGV